ncbi:LamG-like jellyroll fold domain-containing protein, partial [Candidatus Neomarinimicrobiota bacterium]
QNAGCLSCHGSSGGFTIGGDAETAYENIVNGSLGNCGLTYVVPGDPLSSFLYEKISQTPSCGNRMPAGNPTYFDTNTSELEIIQVWISEGASRDTSGLVAHYPFNSNANDESGNGNDGIVYGATLSTDRFGNANSAYSLDGINDYITFPETDDHRLGSGSFSISFFIKPESILSESIVLSKRQANAQWDYGFRIIDGKMVYNVWEGDVNGANCVEGGTIRSMTLVPGEWYHIVGRFDSPNQTIDLVVNDVSQGSYAGASSYTCYNWPAAGGPVPLRISSDHFGNNLYYHGSIDDILLWKRRITDAEIASLYSAGSWDAGLIAYYPFNGNANDASGNGYHGSVNGAALTADRFGNANGAFSFDGVDDYIYVPANGELSFDAATESYSVAVWFRINAFTNNFGDLHIIKDREVGTNSWQSYSLAVNNESNPEASRKRLQNGIWNGAYDSYLVRTADTLQANRWYYGVSAVKAGEVSQLYLDGLLKDALSIVDITDTKGNTGGITIGAGAYPSGLQHFNGDISEVRIYNRALSATEINSLYHEGGWDLEDTTSPATPTNLTATPGDQQITLTWTPNSEADFLRYRIYMSTPPFPISLIDSTIDILDTTYTINGLANGTTYTSYLSAVDINLNESELTTGINATPGAVSTTSNEAMPSEYALHAAYPNPFNPVSTIRYDLPQGSAVSLVVYDIMGREVARLVDGYMELGNQQVIWDSRDKNGREIPSGIYIARLVTPEYTKSIKMVLLK